MDLSQYAELFLAESREHLSACNQLLLEWERNPAAKEPVSGIFRAVHTVKGMAATMGYARVADLAHRAENLLDALRRGSAVVTDDLVQLLFRTVDLLERSVELSVVGREGELDVAAVAAELEQASGAHRSPRRARAPRRRKPRPRRRPSSRWSPRGGPAGTVTLRPDSLLKGGRALIVLRKAQTLGAVHGITPPPAAFESEDFDGRLAFRLDSPEPVEAIVQAIRGAGDVEHVTVAAEDQEELRPEGSLEGARTRHLRVDLRRLDALMDLIGELVIARGRLNELAALRRDPAIDDIAIQVSRLSIDLQDEIIQARMTPVWQVFDRLPRLVRDSARELGKQVAFRIEGKDIELDRAILDELTDPLVHLLRNAVDHGLESPAERRKAGKPAEGDILLAAMRERSSVTITISDDGRGIDRAKVLERAKREGLVESHAETLTDDQLLRILARPGFTTAAAVTKVSGRGVGIDVVTTRLRALGGTIEVRSEPGKSTSFVLRLPVTLAIMRALIASVGRERYALPAHVRVGDSGVRRRTDDHHRGRGGHRAARPGRAARPPAPPARRQGDAPPRAGRSSSWRWAIARAGLVVDGMLGQREIVVKGFDAPLGTLPLFSGATIMGDGIPALILDAGGIL